MTEICPPNPEIISPAEAKFWQEWADKTPALIRMGGEKLGQANSWMSSAQIAGVAMGAALTIASFTKQVPGKWKWASGLAAATSFTGAWAASQMKPALANEQQAFLNYADALEKSPELKAQLADFLGKTVNAEMIQMGGIGYAVGDQALAFGRQIQMIPDSRPMNENNLLSAPACNVR